ncbi:MAG: DnaJ domain-containing protein [Clostridia bacterium]|nr:DnaJ domain-containing protein [Clostridia bacterium]
MSSCFETLGLRAWADPDEIRSAYRSLVKQCHPDMVQDPGEKQAAQERMIRLNLAYEEALRLASPRQHAPYIQEIPKTEAVLLAEKMMARGNPESALRQLLRAESRDASWYYVQGKILMQMEQYESAHQSFREAVLRSPENNEYRTGALEAALAMKKEKTLPGKARKLWKNLTRKD